MTLDNTFKALADPTRREILQMLNDKALSAGDIAKSFNMTKPSVSHHLNILKNAELVIAERDGQNIIYSLNTSVIQEVVQQIMEFFDIGEDDNETE
ncbi:MAG: autorepressor SdpR family transcription factor [Anaerolineae bacterium]|nr:autorepressor SdpR family transcription factor [Anaerolineae bacterium]